jgi:hypothetical protein
LGPTVKHLEQVFCDLAVTLLTVGRLGLEPAQRYERAWRGELVRVASSSISTSRGWVG